jgi:dipeptidyl aminopeptidase/acylaminoacyl peptidase
MSIDLQQFLSLHRVSDPAIHPDGDRALVCLARLNDEGSKRIPELWSVALRGDSEPALVQGGEEGCNSPRFDAAGNLYFLSKRSTESDSENDINQVWRQGPTGEAEVVTNEPLGVLEFRVAGDTLILLAPTTELPLDERREHWRDQKKNGPSGIVYSEMHVRSWDHWMGGPAPHFISYDLKDKERRDITPSFDKQLRADHGLAWDLNSKGTELVVVCLRPGPDRLDDSSLLVIDIASGEHRHLGQDDRVNHIDVRFSPDGSRIAATRHKREHKKHGATSLVIYPSEGGAGKEAARDWDVQPSIGDWHGNDALLVTAPMNGQVPLYRVCLLSDEVTRITSDDAGGSHSDITCSGDNAFGLRHRFEHPPEIFEVALKAQSTPTLHSNLSGLGSIQSVQVESLECSGDGDTPVQYFFLSAGDGSKRPTIMAIHGGPVSAWGDGWHWRWNPLPLLAAGYNVALPNPRGSTGFGQDFIEGVTGNQWGAAAYQDLMAVADQLCKREDVDPEKVAAMGGSFGGYMSNWIGTQTDRFAAIITHASLYRLSAFHGTTDYPAYW